MELGKSQPSASNKTSFWTSNYENDTMGKSSVEFSTLPDFQAATQMAMDLLQYEDARVKLDVQNTVR